MHCQDDRQTRYSSAEVMSVPLVACAFFGGNCALARRFLHQHGYTRTSLSASRFSRRLAQLPSGVWRTLFSLLGEVFKQQNHSGTYIVDSLPLPVCDNIRIRRCKLLQGKAYRGYIASKRRYFFGLRVHLLITAQAEPVEFVLAAGSEADLSVFKGLDLDLPSAAVIYADKGYTSQQEEAFLQEAAQLTLCAQRRRNSKRPLPVCVEFVAQPIRKRIETAFSQITRIFPKHIHAVTPQGFALKVTCFVLVFAIQALNR